MIGAIVFERHKGSVRIGGRGDHPNEVWDEFAEWGHWRNAAMTTFVVDTEPDLQLADAQMSVGYRSARNLCIVRSFKWCVCREPNCVHDNALVPLRSCRDEKKCVRRWHEPPRGSLHGQRVRLRSCTRGKHQQDLYVRVSGSNEGLKGEKRASSRRSFPAHVQRQRRHRRSRI